MADSYDSEAPGTGQQLRLLAIVFAAVCALLALGYWFLLRNDYAVLYSGLTEDDAAAVVEQLQAQDARYRLEAGGTTITVPRRSVDDIRLAIVGSDMPLKGLSGFELFDDSDMGLTDFDQKVKFQRALQGELSRTIMLMDDIERARVHIAIPEKSAFRSEAKTAKAAVTITTRANKPVDDSRVMGIRRLVAAAVPELEIPQVFILNAQGDVISDQMTDGFVTPGAASTEANDDAAGSSTETEKRLQGMLARAIGAAFPALDLEIIVIAVPEEVQGTDLAMISPMLMYSALPSQREIINVSIVTSKPLSNDQREDLSRIVAAVLPSAHPLSAPINFVSPERSLPSAAAESVKPGMLAMFVGHLIALPLWISGLAAAAIIGLIAGLFALLSFRRVLSQEEQEAMANRLSAALRQEEVRSHG